jgi:hypothetical protein
LKTHGIKIDDEELEKPGPDGPHSDFFPGGDRVISMMAPRSRNPVKGALFADKDKSHYVEKLLRSLRSMYHVLICLALYGTI